VIKPKDVLALSSSQRRHLCLALSIDYQKLTREEADRAIVTKANDWNWDLKTLEERMELSKRIHQNNADKFDVSHMVDKSPDSVTTVNILKRYTSAQLTRIAMKLKFPRTYASRLYIAQRIEDLAASYSAPMTFAQLDAILNRKRAVPKPQNDQTMLEG
jgi:hypothetical protein